MPLANCNLIFDKATGMMISSLRYRMEGNFGAVKIWRLTMNSPNFPHPNTLVAKKIVNQASN